MHTDQSAGRSETDHIMVDRTTPEEFARGFVRRPGMYIGSESFERTVGFILGLETVLLRRSRTPKDVATLPTQRHRSLLQRNPADDERAAIARLEPLLVDVLTELRQAEKAAW
jgi:hypothetical protein